LETFIRRTWRELTEEVEYVSRYLRHWWGNMSESEQLFFVGVLCASFLLLGLRRPAKRKQASYTDANHMGVFQQFMFCAALLVIFTFGMDIVVEGFR